MPSLQPDYLARLTLSAGNAAALGRIGEYKGQQELFRHQRPEILEDLRTSAVVESTESSNRIEGIVASKERVRALVERADEPLGRSEQEIAGYRDALNLIHESATEIPFRPSVLLQLHETIYRYHPSRGGRWKSTDNSIVELDARGAVSRVRFDPVSAVATPQAVRDLTESYRLAHDTGAHDPMVLVPLAVLDFTCIHPFTDGNGRLSRLITLLLLYQNGYEVGRWVSLERTVEQSKESYYRALELSSVGWHESEHDPVPWLEYFWGVVLAAYREFETRVGEVAGGKGSKSRQVRAAARRRIRPFSISELERDCPGISRETIRGVLQELRAKGELELTGHGRGARWGPVPRG